MIDLFITNMQLFSSTMDWGRVNYFRVNYSFNWNEMRPIHVNPECG